MNNRSMFKIPNLEEDQQIKTEKFEKMLKIKKRKEKLKNLAVALLFQTHLHLS